MKKTIVRVRNLVGQFTRVGKKVKAAEPTKHPVTIRSIRLQRDTKKK